MIKKYETKQAGIDFKLDIKDNITLIGGPSGSGKTLLFEAFQSDKVLSENSSIICLNYNTDKEFIAEALKNSTGKLIIIDNADTILTSNQKFTISLDEKNQYIVFTHSLNGFKPSENSIAELVVENNIGKLYYPLLED